MCARKRSIVRDQLRHALAGRRLGLDDRRTPAPVRVRLERQHRLHRRHRPVRSLAIRLVHDEDVGDLHDPGLERLDLVAGARHQHDDRDVGGADDVHFVLAHADRFDEDDVLAGGVEDERGVGGRARQPAEVAARRHAADEDAGVGDVRLHADAVAEDRAAGVRAGRIDRDDADGLARSAELRDQAIDQRALAGAGRAGDAGEIGAAGVREHLAHHLGALRRLRLRSRLMARATARGSPWRTRSNSGARAAGVAALTVPAADAQ